MVFTGLLAAQRRRNTHITPASKQFPATRSWCSYSTAPLSWKLIPVDPDSNKRRTTNIWGGSDLGLRRRKKIADVRQSQIMISPIPRPANRKIMPAMLVRSSGRRSILSNKEVAIRMKRVLTNPTTTVASSWCSELMQRRRAQRWLRRGSWRRKLLLSCCPFSKHRRRLTHGEVRVVTGMRM